MTLQDGKYRLSLNRIENDLYADIDVKGDKAEASVFRGDRFGAQYGVIVPITPDIEITLKQKLGAHGIDGALVSIFNNRAAYPDRLPPLPEPATPAPPHGPRL